jgi:hypothetical protein
VSFTAVLQAVDEEVVGADVVYHGTSSDFSGFEARRGVTGRVTGNPTSTWGLFFTPNRTEAVRYVEDFHGGVGTLVSARLRLLNPYRMSLSEFDKHTVPLGGVFAKGPPDWKGAFERESKFVQALIADGYDGVVVRPGSLYEERVVFEPMQATVVRVERVSTR